MKKAQIQNHCLVDDPPWLKIRELQEKLAYDFRQKELLDLALTHSSWANERQRSDHHNERLEFLGDAVLELCVSSELFRRFPDAREGDLTRLRSLLVRSGTLADIARSINLPDVLKLGKGEERQRGRNKDSILSDAMEALLAAIYLDGGIPAASKVINHLYNEHWPVYWRDKQNLDNKSRLQAICQSQFQAFPVYTLVGTTGPPHAPEFEVQVQLPDGTSYSAIDSSCRKAEQNAAGLALENMGNENADL